MEHKVPNPEAIELSEYFGVSEKRIEVIIRKNTPHVKKYLIGTLNNYNVLEANKLLSKFVESCETIEEVIFFCTTFVDAIGKFRDEQFALIAEKCKNN